MLSQEELSTCSQKRDQQQLKHIFKNLGSGCAMMRIFLEVKHVNSNPGCHPFAAKSNSSEYLLCDKLCATFQGNKDTVMY